MQYITTVMESDGVKDLVITNNDIVAEAVSRATPAFVKWNHFVVSENIELFLEEEDLLETYENISSFVSSDMVAFLEAISTITSDTELSQEDKVECISYALSSEDDEELLEGKFWDRTKKVAKGIGKAGAATAAGSAAALGAGKAAMAAKGTGLATQALGAGGAAKLAGAAGAAKGLATGVGAKILGAGKAGAALKAAGIGASTAGTVGLGAAGALGAYGAYKGAKALKKYIQKKKNQKKFGK